MKSFFKIASSPWRHGSVFSLRPSPGTIFGFPPKPSSGLRPPSPAPRAKELPSPAPAGEGKSPPLCGREGEATGIERRPDDFNFPLCILVLIFAVITGGCVTAPLAAANLSAPGWTVQQGQAVWKPAENRRDIAGDLIMATNTDGDCFVQFTKTPLTLATGQIAGGRWQLEFGNEQYSWRGSGTPPDRFVWFQLPRAFSGAPLPGDWHFQTSANGWQFDNSRTGENLEGEFFQ